MPAAPGSGKSTLAAALAFSGWRLFSDEFGLISPETGRILPIPRPVSLKEASISIITRRVPEAMMSRERVDVEGARFVHLRPPTDSVRLAHEDAAVGWIVVPRYIAGAKTTLEKQTRAQTLMQVADQSFNYNYLGAAGFECLAEVVRHADCYALQFSDLEAALGLIGEMTSR
jgi:hypothetical protein